MANSNGWGDGAANNQIGWGQGANNNIGWGDSHAKSWAGATDIVGITTDADAQAFITAAAITDPTQQAAINNLVVGMKADGIWTKMKAVYPFVTDNRNLFSYTEDFGNAYWNRSAITITANSTTAPNGTLTADSIVENTANTDHYVNVLSGLTLTASPYTLSVYSKKAGRDWFSLGLYNGTDSKYAWFNLNTGAIGTIQSGITASIESVGNGWYRCSITRTMAAVSTNYIGFIPTIADGGGAYLGNGTTATYIWGAQLELGSTATTYQPIATTQQAFISSQFKYNLVNPVDSDAAFRLVFNGGWTHSSNGATPNGTNGYADTKLVPSSVLAQNSASVGAYLRTDNIGNYCDIGSSDNPTYNNGLYLFYNVAGNKDYSRNNNDSGAGGTTTASSGFIVNKRTVFSDMKVIRNNSLILSNGNPTTGRSTSPILISAMNRGGTIELYSNRQTAFNFVSDGLTDTEAANLYTRVQAFQTSLSRQV